MRKLLIPVPNDKIKIYKIKAIEMQGETDKDTRKIRLNTQK